MFIQPIKNYFHTGLKDSIVKLCHKRQGVRVMLEGVLFTLNNENVERPHDSTLQRYDNENIGGYATDLSPEDVTKELRFSTVCEYLKNKPGKILDIGCASGELVKYLKDHNGNEVEGIDFSVSIASNRYPDIKFRSGYFRDMDWKADILVFVSTATCFTPHELKETILMARQRGVKTIVLSEPFWWGQKLSADSTNQRSVHAKYICWNHDYCGYLNANGYKTIELRRIKEKDNVDRILIAAELRA